MFKKIKSLRLVLIILIFFINCNKVNGVDTQGQVLDSCIKSVDQNKLNSISEVSKIAFGSCADQNSPQSILSSVETQKPDLFVYLGDNIYADTKNKEVFCDAYKALDKNFSFSNFKKNVPIIATWDDHDYGENDASKDYPLKAQSRKYFLDFWGEPEDSVRRSHDGIYTSYYFGSEEKRVQIILLDLRYFRDKFTTKNYIYTQDNNSSLTMLGVAQWTWLESELKKPAKIRIIGSSTQFVPEVNGFELWDNFPLEKQKFINLIKSTNAEGVFFISGDSHYGEISKMVTSYKLSPKYPIYDITSSGITKEYREDVPNILRIPTTTSESIIHDNNYGLININWKTANSDAEIIVELKTNDTTRLSSTFRISELK